MREIYYTSTAQYKIIFISSRFGLHSENVERFGVIGPNHLKNCDISRNCFVHRFTVTMRCHPFFMWVYLVLYQQRYSHGGLSMHWPSHFIIHPCDALWFSKFSLGPCYTSTFSSIVYLYSDSISSVHLVVMTTQDPRHKLTVKAYFTKPLHS